MKQNYHYGRELRLLTPAHFQTVFNSPPVKAVTAELTVLAVPNYSDHPRLGVTISKKKAKRAVDRNRIKRKIRENFRLKQHKIPAFDIIVIAKNGVVDLSSEDLQQRLDYLWRTLSKRCEQYLSALSDSTS
ncbi:MULTISPECIES: ribonuclease P protein component [Idiomarinaceae]|uniref:Ribonuclease P protein component n=1 Tax=Pseudidiomarina sp. PP-1MA TaxID=3237706 RepID=A0AB39X8W4_9GAMM|nr:MULTISPECIES: ribonuclease P protein component [Idiomarinaceae]MDX1526704.1 ribonuclease P protein component [Pseudidiomarina maritima]MRJ42135.1 ribonuclease P protein component [Idiomarina sp. FeN1]NCU57060.1 ribonuclease P protein component [Idiomarina sp. FenA--70]NCU59769.1 ribonuclease P protein component [Idiomarina sp. FenBw--71]UUN13239.1 ribonuclease P protein component [Idiomarina loihiensis]